MLECVSCTPGGSGAVSKAWKARRGTAGVPKQLEYRDVVAIRCRNCHTWVNRTQGWVAEWSNAPVLKTGVPKRYRGFESLPNRC
jgi:hypothetical protein